MNLLQMKMNELLMVDGINTPDNLLKTRLRNLGVLPESEISIKRFGLFKSTIMIAIGGTWVGLRKEEAQTIAVHKI